jgi:Xaa-Pro aminopeptidase
VRSRGEATAPCLDPDTPPVPVAELTERRHRIVRDLPEDALVVVRGALPEARMRRFRQSNDFYYLTALEVPCAYLVLEVRGASETLYLPHRDPERERVEGPAPACEDADKIARSTGIERVVGLERLAPDLAAALRRGPRVAYVPYAPEETERVTRDSALAAAAWRALDPFGDAGDRPSLAAALRGRFAQLELHDLSPLLDAMRLRKGPHEIEQLRRAAHLCGLAVMEAIRSTEPGIREYELEAVADFVFRQGGARGAGYEAIVAGGANAWFGHYSANDSPLAAGDLVLMDYAPDFGYYTSDIGRMWPVNGHYADWQRELYGFVVQYHHELLTRIQPGATANEILAGAAGAMRASIEASGFSKPQYEAACRAALEFEGHLSHPVGMAVHDVGDYRSAPLEPGVVFSIDPMIWVPEDHLYVRVEDTVLVTEDGVENLTGFVPLELAEVEALMQEPGLLQWWSQHSGTR